MRVMRGWTGDGRASIQQAGTRQRVSMRRMESVSTLMFRNRSRGNYWTLWHVGNRLALSGPSKSCSRQLQHLWLSSWRFPCMRWHQRSFTVCTKMLMLNRLEFSILCRLKNLSLISLSSNSSKRLSSSNSLVKTSHYLLVEVEVLLIKAHQCY